MSGLKWLDRSICRPPVYYALCYSEADFHRELRRLGVPRENWPPFHKTTHANATVNTFETRGKLTSIVCMGSTKGRTREEVYGLLIHEAVHIWQHMREMIGEDNPGREQEAYAIQNIAQALMEAFRDRKK